MDYKDYTPDLGEAWIKQALGEDYLDPNSDTGKAQRKGLEVLMSAEMATSDTFMESAGDCSTCLDNAIFNVEHTERWKAAPRTQGVMALAGAQGKACKSMTKSRAPISIQGTSDRPMMLDMVKYNRHAQKASKSRKYHGIEFVLDKAGRVRGSRSRGTASELQAKTSIDQRAARARASISEAMKGRNGTPKRLTSLQRAALKGKLRGQ